MPVTIALTDTSSPNPSLWVDQDTYGTDNLVYAVSPISPGYTGHKGDWDELYQFCSVLAVGWLNGTRPASWGVSNLGNAGLQSAIATLTSFLLQSAQVDYAVKALDGTKTTIEDITSATPIGTKIWAASNEHVIAAYIDTASTFQFYDPNNGKSRSIARDEFATTMRNYSINIIVMH